MLEILTLHYSIKKTLGDNSEICTNKKWKNNNIREQILLHQKNYIPGRTGGTHWGKQTFPPIILIFTEGEGAGIESRLPFEIFSSLTVKPSSCIYMFSIYNDFVLTVLSTYEHEI